MLYFFIMKHVTWGQRVSELNAYVFLFIVYLSLLMSNDFNKRNKTVFLVIIYADSFKRFAKIIALTPASVVHTTCLVSWYCVAVCSLFFILHLMSWPTVSRFVCGNIKKTNLFEIQHFESSVMVFFRLNPYTEKKDNSKDNVLYMHFTCFFKNSNTIILHDLFSRANLLTYWIKKMTLIQDFVS